MCRSCSAKLRWAGVGLKSYLSSGKSSAMAMSLRPMSFHCSSTACDGLAAGLTAVSFLEASWACSGDAAAAARTRAARSKDLIDFPPYRLKGGRILNARGKKVQGLELKLTLAMPSPFEEASSSPHFGW